jgi:hypothetical protein
VNVNAYTAVTPGVQVWIDNVAVIDSSSISATPTATVTFPLANTLYNVFIAYERWETVANVFCAHSSFALKIVFCFSAAAANFGFQIRWSKLTPNGPLNPPRAFKEVAAAVVTTE